MSSTSSAIMRYPRCSLRGAGSIAAPSYEISSTTVPPRSRYTRSIGTPKDERSTRSRAFHSESQHLGVELHGLIQLVRDDFDVVDPFEHLVSCSFANLDHRPLSKK